MNHGALLTRLPVWLAIAAYAIAAAVTGVRWGGGLFLNYLFALGWLADVLWWWLAPVSFARRSPRLTADWQAFVFFMIFNGAVVFGHGPVRWFGALVCTTLAGLW